MPLKSLNISGTKVADLAPLKNCPLNQLNCGFTLVKDISALGNIGTLRDLNIIGIKSPDITALHSLQLTRILIEYRGDLHGKILREMKTLGIINGKSVGEFWSNSP